MGGRGFTIHIAAQSIAQLRDTWGRDRAEAILGNTASLLLFGGLKNADDLQDAATLCGTRLMALDPDDNRPMPVMTAHEISELAPGTALVLRNGLRPVVGRAPSVLDRRDPVLVPALAAAWRQLDALVDDLAERIAARRKAAVPSLASLASREVDGTENGEVA